MWQLTHNRTKSCWIVWMPKAKGTLKENANPRKDPTKKTRDSAAALRVHVPHYYIPGAQSPYIGSTLRPKYTISRYMDP